MFDDCMALSISCIPVCAMYSLQLPSKLLISFLPTTNAGSARTPNIVVLFCSLIFPIERPGGSFDNNVATPSAGTLHISTATGTPLVALPEDVPLLDVYH
jgi:hypothetical protein